MSCLTQAAVAVIVSIAAASLFDWGQLGSLPSFVFPFRGDLHAWWVVVALPRHTVQGMLPPGVEILNTSFPGVPRGSHPILIELGWQDEAGIRFLPLTHTSFGEMAVSIPDARIARAPRGMPALVFKPVERLQSLYHTKMAVAEIAMAINSYRGTLREGRTLFASLPRHVAAEPSAWRPALVEHHFSPLREIADALWFGGDPSRCAYRQYDWRSALVLPVRIRLHVPDHALPDPFPMGDWVTPGLEGKIRPDPGLVLAAYEIKAPHLNSLPFACDEAALGGEKGA